MKSYTLSQQWIIREDPCVSPRFSAYNIFTDKVYALNESIYTLLKIFKYNIISIEALLDILNKNETLFTTEQIITHLISQQKEYPFIEESDRVYCDKFIENQYVKEFKQSLVSLYQFPLEVEIHLTKNCNLSCRHCCYSSQPLMNPNIIQPQEWFDIFDQLENGDTRRIALSGGEVMSYPYIIDILHYLSHKRFKIDILTNGTLLTPQIAQILSNKRFSVSLSLDGINAETHDFLRGKGVFDKVMKNIALLCMYNVDFHLSMTLHRKNIEEIEEIIKFAIEKNVKSVNFIFIDLIGRANQYPDLYLEKHDVNNVVNIIAEYVNKYAGKMIINYLNPQQPVIKYISTENNEKIYCSAGTSRLAINESGKIYPCVYGFDVNMSFGDALTEKIKDIWYKSAWELFRGKISLSDLPDCVDCKIVSKCELKMCRLKALLYSGNLYGKPLNCYKEKI